MLSEERSDTAKSTSTDYQQILCNYFCMPLSDAALAMNVSTSTLKKMCREMGITKWPYRQLRSLEQMLEKLEATVVKDQEMTNTIEKLKRKIHRIKTNPTLDVMDIQKDRKEFRVVSRKRRKKRSPLEYQQLTHHFELGQKPVNVNSRAASISSSPLSSTSDCLSQYHPAHMPQKHLYPEKQHQLQQQLAQQYPMYAQKMYQGRFVCSSGLPQNLPQNDRSTFQLQAPSNRSVQLTSVIAPPDPPSVTPYRRTYSAPDNVIIYPSAHVESPQLHTPTPNSQEFYAQRQSIRPSQLSITPNISYVATPALSSGRQHNVQVSPYSNQVIPIQKVVSMNPSSNNNSNMSLSPLRKEFHSSPIRQTYPGSVQMAALPQRSYSFSSDTASSSVNTSPTSNEVNVPLSLQTGMVKPPPKSDTMIHSAMSLSRLLS